MQRTISIAALVCIVWAGSAFAQVNSSIGGIVQDPSKALIPGVTITATNTQTGGAGATISINSTSGGDFGYLTNAKTGTRSFQGQLRLTF
jgi:hypothetical protein